HGDAYSEMERDGLILPVSRVEYRLMRPARYDDLLTVETTVDRVRSRSVTFRYRVLRGEDLLVEGMTEHICVNPDHKPTAFSPRARAALGADS
ncbi:MAG: acyl-CoA thioesterase, partial [Gemmatimonadetes bacterium]|nr:acyl-CoA thioesterase [Gemmatimonadota bacterium]